MFATRAIALYRSYVRNSLRWYFRWRRSWFGGPQRWLEGHPLFIFGPVAVVSAVLGLSLALSGGLALLASAPLLLLAGLMAVLLYSFYS